MSCEPDVLEPPRYPYEAPFWTEAKIDAHLVVHAIFEAAYAERSGNGVLEAALDPTNYFELIQHPDDPAFYEPGVSGSLADLIPEAMPNEADAIKAQLDGSGAVGDIVVIGSGEWNVVAVDYEWWS